MFLSMCVEVLLMSAGYDVSFTDTCRLRMSNVFLNSVLWCVPRIASLSFPRYFVRGDYRVFRM